MIDLIKNLISEYSYLHPIIIYIITGVVIYKIFNKIVGKISQFNNPLAIHWTFIRLITKTILIIVITYASLILIPAFQTIPTVLLTNISIITAALAFASQNLLNNIISGIILSATKPFAVNDRIRLVSSGVVGFVESINFRYTTIKTPENNRLLIPNAILSQEIIENSNHTETRICNFLDMNFTYDSNVDEIKSIITGLVKNHPSFIDCRTDIEKENGTPIVRVLIRNIADNKIEIRTGIWTKTIGENFIMCSDIREAIIKESMKNDDITLYQTIIRME